VSFHPVVLQHEPVVLDLSTNAPVFPDTPWTIGRYDEVRPGLYTQPLFGGARTVHMGVDLGAPAGAAVHAFDRGTIVHAGYNPAPGDYGHVLVARHRLDGRPVYALYGHLSAASVPRWAPGHSFGRGEVLGWLGDRAENGGWTPHLHFQLSWDRPDTHDMPGAVHHDERAEALERYPDPRRVLGPIYS